jgi:hypothetical protein
MINSLDVIKKAADQCGFKRISYDDNKVPTNINNVTILLFFGDIKYTVLASSLLMKRYKEESKGSKYFILCSWQGCQDLFPYVDEYWELSDLNNYKLINNNCNMLNNTSDAIDGYKRLLNGFFYEVLDATVFNEYYDHGFTQEFFERYKNIKRYLPSIPSSIVLGNEFNKKINDNTSKVLIYPTMYINDWNNGCYFKQHVLDTFWESFVERLLSEHITPVIYQDFKTYDLSSKYYDKCIFLKNSNIMNVLSGMRSTGLVLDLFNGISKYAILARCPYLLCVDRVVYNHVKEYEIDILCGNEIPRDNFYVFPSICHESNKNNWNSMLFDSIILKLKSLINDITKDNLPSPIEVNDIVRYELARKEKIKKLGVKFIKVKNF